MKLSNSTWVLLAAAAALTPAGLRAVTWIRERPKPVDATMAKAGDVLFSHEWTANDPLANGGDGLGPVFNAKSCAICHSQGGVGGGGDLEMNVTTYSVRFGLASQTTRDGVVHLHGGETLQNVHPSLPAIAKPRLEQLVRMPGATRADSIAFPRGVRVSQLNTPALFGAKLVDDLPDRVILANERAQRVKWGLAPAGAADLPVGRAVRLPNGRIGKFGWKAQSPNLASFVQAACANELGLGNPGQAQPVPLNNTTYVAQGLDLTQEQCDQLTSFVASLAKPVEKVSENAAEAAHAKAGKKLFGTIGCADCHQPNVGNVTGIYSDLLLHRMGQELEGGGSYYDILIPSPDDPSNPAAGPSEWRTPPLWGVADSAPYLHDGRAATLEDAIRMHAGQGVRSAARFGALSPAEQTQVVVFLKTLRAPQP